MGCGSVAQLVEQRPEEPCVDGSSPPGATKPSKETASQADFLLHEKSAPLLARLFAAECTSEPESNSD